MLNSIEIEDFEMVRPPLPSAPLPPQNGPPSWVYRGTWTPPTFVTPSHRMDRAEILGHDNPGGLTPPICFGICLRPKMPPGHALKGPFGPSRPGPISRKRLDLATCGFLRYVQETKADVFASIKWGLEAREQGLKMRPK